MRQINHKNAFSSISPLNNEKKQVKSKNDDSSIKQTEDNSDSKKEYEEPDVSDLINDDEIEEIEKELLSQGYSINEAMKIINGYIDELKQKHKEMHEKGELDSLYQEDEDQEGQEDEDQEDEDKSKGEVKSLPNKTTKEEDNQEDDEEDPSDKEAEDIKNKEMKNPDEILALLNKYLDINDKHHSNILDIMKNLIRSKK